MVLAIVTDKKNAEFKFHCSGYKVVFPTIETESFKIASSSFYKNKTEILHKPKQIKYNVIISNKMITFANKTINLSRPFTTKYEINLLLSCCTTVGL